MDKSLSQQVATGTAWMLLLRTSLRGLGAISTVILARLLTPDDFGLVAIAMALFGFLYLIKEFGFDIAIIQMKTPTKEHYDTAWTFNFMFGVTLALILIIFSGVISGFYETPELQPLLCTVASLFIINGLESVGTLDFRKNLTFDKEFKYKIVPKLVGLPCTLFMAYSLRSYWALTIGTIITSLTQLLVGYMMHSYRPKLCLAAAKELFNFSKWLMANNFMYFINTRSPELFIGKLINPAAAGIFTISNEVATMPTAELSSAVSRASYPGYAKVADDPDQLKNLYLNVLSSTAVLLIPITIGIVMTARLFVPILLGEQWLETIPLIEVLSLSGLLIALVSNIGYVFMAIGSPKISAILSALRVLIFIPLLVVLTKSTGVEGAALATLLSAAAMFFVTNYFVVSKLPISLIDIVRAVYRPVAGSIIMMIAVAPLTHIDQSKELMQSIYQLLNAVSVGVVTYILAVYLLWFFEGKPNCLEAKAYSKIVGFIKVKTGNP